MNEETQIIAKSPKPRSSRPPQSESSLFGCSVRGWIAIMFFGTLCGLQAAVAYICFQRHVEFVIDNQFWIMASVIIGFYYGKQPAPLPPTSVSSTTVTETKIPGP